MIKWMSRYLTQMESISEIMQIQIKAVDVHAEKMMIDKNIDSFIKIHCIKFDQNLSISRFIPNLV